MRLCSSVTTTPWRSQVVATTISCQISSVYQSLRSCRDNWKDSQLWCWIGTQNTCKLFFCGDTKVLITWVKNSFEKLDNKLRVKVKK